MGLAGEPSVRGEHGKRLLKVGDTASTGHVVSEILGQGPNGAVFIAANDDIRWIYKKNEACCQISWARSSPNSTPSWRPSRPFKAPLVEKRHLYKLAGKTLYMAIAADAPMSPATLFSDVERRVLALTAGLGGGNESRPALSADLVVVWALHAPELVSVLALSPSSEGPRITGDPQTYHTRNGSPRRAHC